MKQELKICSPELGISPKSYLGGEVHDYFVLDWLAKKGVKVYTYLPRKSDYKKNHNLIVVHSQFRHFPALLFNILIIPYLFKTYKSIKFNILRVHNPYFVGPGAILFKSIHRNVRIVATYHLVENSLLYRLIDMLIAKRFDAIFVVSEHLKEWLVKKYKVDSRKIYVIHNGVDPNIKPKSKPQELVNKYKLQDKFIILYLGLFIPRKNPMLIINLYKELKTMESNVAIFFCGKGPLLNKMKNFTKINQLGDVVFTGVVKGNKKLDFINLSDVLILPSAREGMPIAAVEAMACRKVVLTSKGNSSNDLIENGIDGFICKNKSDYIKKIIFLKNNKYKYKKMADLSYKKIKKHFQWEKSVEVQIQVYKKLLST